MSMAEPADPCPNCKHRVDQHDESERCWAAVYALAPGLVRQNAYADGVAGASIIVSCQCRSTVAAS